MTIKLLKKKTESVINKGAPVFEDVKLAKSVTNFNIRMPTELSHQIDAHLENVFGMTKTGFILQAIQKELRKG